MNVPMTQNVNIGEEKILPSPRELREFCSVSSEVYEWIAEQRQIKKDIIAGRDRRMAVYLGGCAERTFDESMVVTESAVRLQERCPNFVIYKRTCVDKPRTITGWRGIATDPRFDKSYDVVGGYQLVRRICCKQAEMRVRTVMEFFGPYTINRMSDVLPGGWIGARTVLDGNHRHQAGGSSFPVGMKNTTDGSVIGAIEAILTAREPGPFIGDNDEGRTEMLLSKEGNAYGFVMLRGGKKPNYFPEDIAATFASLRKVGLPEVVLVDASHGNCLVEKGVDGDSNPKFVKDENKQIEVVLNLIDQRVKGTKGIIGFAIESDVVGSRYDIPLIKTENGFKVDQSKIIFGKSFTDPCLPMDVAEQLIIEAHDRFTASL
jgi:3-deoxy-7-phosphoheptulonate synthase